MWFINGAVYFILCSLRQNRQREWLADLGCGPDCCVDSDVEHWVTQAVSTINLWPHSPFTGGGPVVFSFCSALWWVTTEAFCECLLAVGDGAARSHRLFPWGRLASGGLGGCGGQGDQLCWISVWGAWSPVVLMILYFIYVPYGQWSNLGGSESTSPADICQTSQPQFGLREQQSFKDTEWFDFFIYLFFKFSTRIIEESRPRCFFCFVFFSRYFSPHGHVLINTLICI